MTRDNTDISNADRKSSFFTVQIEYIESNIQNRIGEYIHSNRESAPLSSASNSAGSGRDANRLTAR